MRFNPLPLKQEKETWARVGTSTKIKTVSIHFLSNKRKKRMQYYITKALRRCFNPLPLKQEKETFLFEFFDFEYLFQSTSSQTRERNSGLIVLKIMYYKMLY